MKKIVMLGAPGSGKGTQSGKLVDYFGMYKFSTGDILRNEVALQTRLGEKIGYILDRGDLVDDETILNVVRTRITNMLSEQDRGMVFDGFPRTVKQAEGLDL